MTIINPNRDELQNILQYLEQAIHDHNLWLMDWHRAIILQTSADAPQVSDNSPLYCKFGKWYHQASRYLTRFPIFEKIGLLHIHMHAAADQLLAQKSDNKTNFLREYDAFLALREEFRELVRIFETELREFLLRLDSIPRIIDRRRMIPRIYQCQERLTTQQEGSVICLLNLNYRHHYGQVVDELNYRHYYGRAVDEQIIATIAHLLATYLRAEDIIFRSDEETFILVLVNVSMATANSVLERLCAIISDQTIVFDSRSSLKVAAAFGMAPLEMGVSVEESMDRAARTLGEINGWIPSLTQGADERGRMCQHPMIQSLACYSQRF
ncbi:putative Diguanylate kinase [Gammaproteobacteria bacterium]